VLLYGHTTESRENTMTIITAADLIAGTASFDDLAFDNAETDALVAVKAMARVLYGPQRRMPRTYTDTETRVLQRRGMESTAIHACNGDEKLGFELFDAAIDWASDF